MEAFPVGSHVVIELMDERKIAGYLVSGSIEEGVLMKVTHKDSELIRNVSEGTKANIAEQLAGKSIWWLRGGMVLRGQFRGAIAERAIMEMVLQEEIEGDLLEQSDDGMQFRELSSPVLTYVNPGVIMLMEATADKLKEADISVFDQTLDAALEQILTMGEEEEATKETNEETEGIQGSTGRGTEEGAGA